MKLLLLGIATLALGGCVGTVIPHRVPGSVTPDGVALTSGFIRWVYEPGNKVPVGAYFTSGAHDRYNYLLGKFGGDLKPPRAPDFGVTTDGLTYFLNFEACVDFEQMAGWDRGNEHPPKTLLEKLGVTK